MLGYNKMTGYNKARYNADGTEIQKADSMTVADATIIRNFQRALTELIVMADTTAKQQNKSVTEVLKLDTWLSIDRKDASKWED